MAVIMTLLVHGYEAASGISQTCSTTYIGRKTYSCGDCLELTEEPNLSLVCTVCDFYVPNNVDIFKYERENPDLGTYDLGEIGCSGGSLAYFGKHFILFTCMFLCAALTLFFVVRYFMKSGARRGRTQEQVVHATLRPVTLDDYQANHQPNNPHVQPAPNNPFGSAEKDTNQHAKAD